MSGSLTAIAGEQVFLMFLLILTGFAAVKTGVVKSEARSAFSDLLVNIVLPAMIINSYIMEFDPSIMSNLLMALVGSVVVLGSGALVCALLCIKNKDADMPLVRFAMAAGNAGYMGFPLITALFGSEGLIYASMFLTVYNLFVWTIGVRSVDRENKSGVLSALLEALKNPAIIAVVIGIVIYFTQIPIPGIILQPVQLLGNMNTPLAMLITGMIMAGGGIFQTVRDKRLWEGTVVRLILLPVLALLICRLMGIGGIVRAVMVILAGCPCASITSVFAVQYHYDESLGAGLVVISTLLSIFTLPFFASLL